MTEAQVRDSWHGMFYRCFYPTSPAWDRYGGRGITVCDRWSDPRVGYENFRRDMGRPRRRERLTIDRIDPDGNYEPRNCRWATDEQQARNKSRITAEKLWSHIIDKFLCLHPMRYDAYIERVRRRREEGPWSYWHVRDLYFNPTGGTAARQEREANARASIAASLSDDMWKARQVAGLSLSGLAKKLKKSTSSVANRENGRTSVSEAYVSAVLKACDLPSDWKAAKAA